MAFLDGNGLGTLLIALKNYFVSKTTLDNTIEDFSDGKQDLLISGSNIKTINNQSILGSGNLAISGSSDNFGLLVTCTFNTDTNQLLCDKTPRDILNALNSGIFPVFKQVIESNDAFYYFIKTVSHNSSSFYIIIGSSDSTGFNGDIPNEYLDTNMVLDSNAV